MPRYAVCMGRVLIVTIDGEPYRVEGDRTPEEALADFQRRMRDGALDDLPLADGPRMVVNWGRVTAVSVTDAEPRDEELSYTGPAEPRWPERPF
jgi:hypothetical protein